MALSKKYNFEIYGKAIEFDSCYIEIININGTKNIINMYVNIYDSNLKEHVIITKSYNYVPNLTDSTVNNFKQGYEYLKTLEEYKDAIDC